MAGIGFELRRLMGRNDLLGVGEGGVRSALASTGPWLFAVLCMAGIDVLGPRLVSRTELSAFQIIVYYNFAFSLVLSGPLLAIVTRRLSDMVFAWRVEDAMGLMLGSLALLYGALSLVVLPFYFGLVALPFATRLFACMNFFLISGIWLVHVFLPTLHRDRAVAACFLVGSALSFAGATALGKPFSTAGMLLGFNAGMAVVLFSLIGLVFAEYPRGVGHPWQFLAGFRRHWKLAAGGLAYNAAIWADKWVMWGAPERERHVCGLVSFSHYDGAMFLAFLTIVPAIALFVLNVETRFYEKYLAYLRSIRDHAPWRVIEQSRRGILDAVVAGGRQILLWQGLVTVAAILLAPWILEHLRIAFVQLGMFRLGVLGAFFHVLLVCLLILLSYFELSRETLLLQVFFLVSNAAFTKWTLSRGFAWYGFGYVMAAVLTFALAAITAFRLLPTIAYETFVRRNSSLSRTTSR